MYNYRLITPDSSFKFDFVAKEFNSHVVNAIDKTTGTIAGTVTLDDCTFDASSDEIFMNYKLYQTRPERHVGKFARIQGLNMDELVSEYEELLIGAYILTQHCSVEPNSKTYGTMIDWLRQTDFYTAPASTRFHEAFPAGLLVHSLNVYNKMIELSKLKDFKTANIAEATLVALIHDWCKIGYYEAYQKNVKNNSTREWETRTSYRVNQRGLPLGHGVTSLYLAMQFMSLTTEQALAIRWHQGRWNVCDLEQNEFQKANADYPMVYMIQFADMLACTSYPNS